MPLNDKAGRLATDQLRVLRASYAKGLPEKVERLRALWKTLRTRNQPHGKAMDDLRMEVHRLAGSGATYGYTRLSGLMQSIEQKLDQWADFPEDATSLIIELDRLFAALREVTLPDDPGDDLQATELVTKRMATDRLHIVMLAEPDEQASDLRRLMRQYGFEISLCSAPECDCVAQLVKAQPDLLLIQEAAYSDSLIESLRNQMEAMPYIMVLASAPHLLQRVEYYRRGVHSVLPWPVDSTDLIAEIESCFANVREMPFRVLLIDDDVELGLYYAQVLSSAGMLTRVVGDPEEVESALEEFRPDVILMDLYMPEYNGIELASAIRQDPAFFGVPIIFASVEKDIIRHIGPIRAGGDDFLIKPVPVPFLIASIETRARRGRELRRMINRDGLTNLLNHVAIEEVLEREVARAERNESPLVFVMLDLDHFKQINDTYGHVMGDKVLVDFAHLLKNRLRRSDSVGRYGGEEFSVILPDTETDEAVHLIDALRESFAGIEHRLGKTGVNVTFSAGLASWKPGMSPETLRQQADKALYQAKHNGRNRLEVWQDKE